jgi:hypothetical protein
MHLSGGSRHADTEESTMGNLGDSALRGTSVIVHSGNFGDNALHVARAAERNEDPRRSSGRTSD